MKLRLSVLAVMAATPALVNAAALERSNQSVAAFFEKGNYAELSYVYVDPDIPGKYDVGLRPDIDGSAAKSYGYTGAALKFAPNDKTSVAIIYDQPWGVDYDYADTSSDVAPGVPAPFNPLNVRVKTDQVTTLVGGQVLNNVWLYGGLAYNNINTYLNSGAIAYDASGIGYVGGAAYTIPDIALRASVTYRSKVDIDNPTAAIKSFNTPQNVNLEFQTGINPLTLLMLDARWVNWSDFTNQTPTGTTIVEYKDDQISGSIGLGRKLTDNFSGVVKVSYDTGAGDIISPFGPYQEKIGISIGGKYKFNKNVDASLGVAYTQLEGDTVLDTGTPVATFDDANAIAVGGKLGFHF